MSKIFYAVIGITLLFGCKDSGSEGGESQENASGEELARLRSENRALTDKLAIKDSVINESFMLFNEIENNLAMIDLKEDEIRVRTQNVELEEDSKEWILQEIEHINYLREANQNKVKELNKALKKNEIEIDQFKQTINNLMNKIEVQEEEIEMLRTELADLDQEYVELLEAYQSQSELTAEVLKELDNAYYVFGSSDELTENGVIVKEGGFIGIGKKNALKEDFNEDYFTRVSKSGTEKIEVFGKKVKFVTDHPSSSYDIKSDGEKHIIQINDHQVFWKVSKYLVIVVD